MKLSKIYRFSEEFDAYLNREIDILERNVAENPQGDRSMLLYKSTHRLRYSLTMRELLEHVTLSDRVLETAGFSNVSRFLGMKGMAVFETQGDLRYPLMNIESKSMDVVFSFEVIEHIKDHDGTENLDYFNLSGVFTYVSELFRVLKPGGIAVVSTPNACASNLIGSIIAMEPPNMFRPHVREYAPGEIIEFFQERQGFRTKVLKTFDSYPARPERDACDKFLADIKADLTFRGDTIFSVFQRP